MIYLLFRAIRTRPRPFWAFWQQRHSADVYAFIAVDAIDAAKARAIADMARRGWRIESYRVARAVDDTFRRDSADVRVRIWAASKEGYDYRFYPPFEYAADATAPVTSRYMDNPEVRLQPDRVPEGLRPLLQFAERWAILDDVERSNAVAAATPRERQALVSAVTPLFAEIERYAAENAASVPIPDEVVVLDLIAEAADLAGFAPSPDTA